MKKMLADLAGYLSLSQPAQKKAFRRRLSQKAVGNTEGKKKSRRAVAAGKGQGEGRERDGGAVGCVKYLLCSPQELFFASG